jgi:Na+-driven multidrug efflux pump
MIFAIILILGGIVLYFYGKPIASHLLNPNNPLSGSYIVIFSVFLVIAGFLVLVSQIFRGKSVLY